MNLSFHIQPTSINTIDADLYLEISAQGLSYIIAAGGTCMALAVYDFDTCISDETTADYIHQVIASQPVLQQKYNKVHIIYGYAASILVPPQFMIDTDHNAMLELVYGDVNEQVTRTEPVKGQSIQNLYGIPKVIEMVMSRYFGDAENIHLFSVLPELVKDAGNHLYCIFKMEQLKVLLTSDGNLQAMQSYTFRTPEDVAYHLLNLCSVFEVNPGDTLLHISGMIEEGSPLYKELCNYFPRLKFEPLPVQYQYPDEINQYPAHYFSHLFAIAACV